MHAVSVGEVLAVSHLVAELQKKYPERQVLVSTTTATGQSLARQRFGEDRVFFMPLDFGFAVRRYLAALQAAAYRDCRNRVLAQPSALGPQAAGVAGDVNARISDRSFPRYRRFGWFFGRVLAEVDLFLAQTADDAPRLRDIGAAYRSASSVSGNLKFDIRPSPQPVLS